jgi:hypothetical protein
LSKVSRRKFLYAGAGAGVAAVVSIGYLTKDYWYSLIKDTVFYKVESLAIADLEYPKTVKAGSTFTVKVIVKHVLHAQKDVFITLYDNAGRYRGGFYWILKGEGSRIYNLMVTAPLSTKKGWALKIHLNGEYKKSIYMDVKENLVSPPTKVKLHMS